MSTHAIRRVGSPAVRLSLRVRHLMWLGAGLVFGFLVSFVFADTLDLPRDLFFGIYAASVLTFFAAWAKSTGQSFSGMLRRRWVVALPLGLVFAGVMALIAIRTEDATARPDGIELVAAVLWRGVVYGLADGLLLSAFPILAVFAAFAGTKLRERLIGKMAIGLAAGGSASRSTTSMRSGAEEPRSASGRRRSSATRRGHAPRHRRCSYHRTLGAVRAPTVLPNQATNGGRQHPPRVGHEMLSMRTQRQGARQDVPGHDARYWP